MFDTIFLRCDFAIPRVCCVLAGRWFGLEWLNAVGSNVFFASLLKGGLSSKVYNLKDV